MSGDSNSDNETILQEVFDYEPNKALATVGGVFFFILSFVIFVHVRRWRHYWGLCLPIGALTYCTGFFLRIPIASHPNSLGIFVAMQMFLVLSPAAFLAFNYIVYGRFIRNSVGRKYTLINPLIISRIFVISDVTTFLMQGAGGGIEEGNNTVVLGQRILLIGLILQTASYAVFEGLVIYSHYKIRKDNALPLDNEKWRVVRLLHFSSIFILIRGVYRVVELGQGDGGFLLTHEVFFYCLDTLPLFIATGVYAVHWPGRYVVDEGIAKPLGIFGRRRNDLDDVEMSNTEGVNNEMTSQK